MKTEPITWPLPDDFHLRQFWRTYDHTRWRLLRCHEVETSPGASRGAMTFERVTRRGTIPKRRERRLWTTLCFNEHAKTGHLRIITPKP